MNSQSTSDWYIEETCFDPERVVLNGSRYLLGNGYMGYRGTLEEFRAQQLVGNMVAGLYDKIGDNWREPVNAPNAFFTRVIYKGDPLNPLDTKIEYHRQGLDIRRACHRRQTVFVAEDGNHISIEAERFLSFENVHLMAMDYSIQCSRTAPVQIETGIDLAVWDINGPHLEAFHLKCCDGILVLESRTRECGFNLSVAEACCWDGFECRETVDVQTGVRTLRFVASAGRQYRFRKYVTVFSGCDGVASVGTAAFEECRAARSAGYSALFQENESAWERKWARADVQIDGDPQAQFALRYSIYHLLAIAPGHSERLSIPARGLSGQVYKGAVFWDTEMFMLPFFLSVAPVVARNLLLYRVHTLDGARRKSKEYGYDGAFYAWESQETGDDACTHFNVTDVFTGRPMRTHFRDKQIHISAAVAYSFWKYFIQTGDSQIFMEGGAEVVLECARFFYSYAYYKVSKDRFELLDVTGPDEYHERVNNNAYTNRMVLETVDIALQVMELVRNTSPEYLDGLLNRIAFPDAFQWLTRLKNELYIPKANPASGVISQFDGYEVLEDVSLPGLKSRILTPSEYLGGGNGLATTTQILKQADVVLMLSLFGNDYANEIKRRNWEYYEPRTEHGSSLSACAYGIVATEIGETDRAYQFFLQAATIDITGKSKQYIGPLYIGGTHPAANGGAWMVAVTGFSGLRITEEGLSLEPKLPLSWNRLQFNACWHGLWFRVSIRPQDVQIEADSQNQAVAQWKVGGQPVACSPGQAVVMPLMREA